MNLVVLTKNPDSYAFGGYLRKKGYRPLVCVDLASVLDVHGVKPVDLLLCDFRYFELESRNPYETMHEKIGGKIPFVFYNDPFPEFRPEALKGQWRSTVVQYYGSVCDEVDSFLDTLSRAVIIAKVNADVEPENHADEKSSVPEKLRDMLSLPNSKFRLFEILFKNRGEQVDGLDLCRKLWNRDEERDMANLYAYIAFIRKRIGEFPHLGMSVRKSEKGKYVFEINPAALEKL